MTQDTQAGAGAQPAPAIQPEALRIAMHLRQRAQLSRPGNLDTLSASGANELERQHAELSAARAEAKHWRSNHDNVVARLRIFTQRPDIPKELADRLPWYRELVRLQAVEAQALQQSAEITDAEIDRIAESMPGGLDGFLKAWGWRQFARAILQAAPPAPAAVAVPAEILDALGMTEGEVDDVVVRIQDMSAARHDAEEARDELATTPAQEHATQLAGQDGEQDEGLAQAIDERDTAEGWADGLAGLIAAHFGQDIGEHSSAHNPWQEAKDIIEEAEPYRPAAAPAQAQEDARDALTLEELDQLDRAMEHFVEGEDTDVDWRLLTRAACLGILECERFTVPPSARAAIDAARAAQGGDKP